MHRAECVACAGLRITVAMVAIHSAGFLLEGSVRTIGRPKATTVACGPKPLTCGGGIRV